LGPQVVVAATRDVIGGRVVPVERAGQADRRIFVEQVVDAEGQLQAVHPVEAVTELDVVVGGRRQHIGVAGRVGADREAAGAAAALAQLADGADAPGRVPGPVLPVHREGRGPVGNGTGGHLDARALRLRLAGSANRLVLADQGVAPGRTELAPTAFRE